MKNKILVNLQRIVIRFVFVGIWLFIVMMDSLSIVHAQGTMREAATLPSKSETADFISMRTGDDCGRDDEGKIENIVLSDSSKCRPRVRISTVWTADENMEPKTAFVPGEPIQWVITVRNTTNRTVSVKLIYIVRNPSGEVIRRSERRVSASPGISFWARSGVARHTSGTYSLTGILKYHDSTTRKTVKYEVGSSCHTLTLSGDPSAGGTATASPAPNCNSGTQYSSGTLVTLTATTNAGYEFANWSGDATGSTNPVTITMTGDRTVTANFSPFDGLTEGIHDDTDAAWSYTGNWAVDANAGYHNGTSHVSTTLNNSARVTIEGMQFILYYTSASGQGALDVYVDNVKVDTIDESNTTTTYQSTWTSDVLTSGVHELNFVHANGTTVNIDAIEVVDASAPNVPGIATLISPDGSIVMNHPTYVWNEVTDSTRYYLWVNGPSGVVINQWYTATEANCNGTTCSVTPDTTLSLGAHRWWIQTSNSFGDGPWSEPMFFDVDRVGAATLISPNTDIGANYNPTYTWNEVPDAIRYYLWVNGPSGTVIQQWYTAAEANCDGTTCSVTPSQVLSAGSHTWWIQTYGPTGDGPWSDHLTFSTSIATAAGKATLISPNGSIATNNPTYTWSEVSGSTWYYLWVNGPSGTVIQQWYTAAEASCNGTTCSVTPATTLGSGAHTWWIMTYNSAGDGPWSDGLGFTSP